MTANQVTQWIKALPDNQLEAAITAIDYCLIEPEGTFTDEEGHLDQKQADAAKAVLTQLQTEQSRRHLHPNPPNPLHHDR